MTARQRLLPERERARIFNLNTEFSLHSSLHKVNKFSATHCRCLSKLNSREIEFLRLACSERTYKEIAAEMFVSPRTVDGYRDGLFMKLQVKSRVGLALFAVQHGLWT